MKKLKNKILIIFITIIMVSNFIIPNYIYANTIGDKVVNGIFYFFAWVGDKALEFMQETMIGDNYIGKDQYGYKIKYSPGIIFANEVPALDINFFNPSSKEIKAIKNYRYWRT